MALLTILTGGQAKRVGFKTEDGTSDILVIDATLSETTSLEAEVTDHPVEDGPDINDHIRPKPVIVDIEGMISETPLTLSTDLQRMTTEPEAAIKNIARGFGGGVAAGIARKFGSQFGSAAGTAAGLAGAALFQSSSNPAEAARNILEQMLINKVRFTLQTKYKAYRNMVLISISFPRTNEQGKSLKFTARCKEIRVITGETVEIKKIARNAPGAMKKTKLGTQPKQEAKQEVQRRSSILFKGLQVVREKFGG